MASYAGKRYEIPISEGGTIKATDLKQIKAGGDGQGELHAPWGHAGGARTEPIVRAGLKLFDPGYMNTAVCKSSISYIDGKCTRPSTLPICPPRSRQDLMQATRGSSGTAATRSRSWQTSRPLPRRALGRRVEGRAPQAN